MDIPEDMQELAAEYREKLVEQVGALLFAGLRSWRLVDFGAAGGAGGR